MGSGVISKNSALAPCVPTAPTQGLPTRAPAPPCGPARDRAGVHAAASGGQGRGRRRAVPSHCSWRTAGDVLRGPESGSLVSAWRTSCCFCRREGRGGLPGPAGPNAEKTTETPSLRATSRGWEEEPGTAAGGVRRQPGRLSAGRGAGRRPPWTVTGHQPGRRQRPARGLQQQKRVCKPRGPAHSGHVGPSAPLRGRWEWTQKPCAHQQGGPQGWGGACGRAGGVPWGRGGDRLGQIGRSAPLSIRHTLVLGRAQG